MFFFFLNKEDSVEGGEDEGDDEIIESGIHEDILARPSPVPESQKQAEG